MKEKIKARLYDWMKLFQESVDTLLKNSKAIITIICLLASGLGFSVYKNFDRSDVIEDLKIPVVTSQKEREIEEVEEMTMTITNVVVEDLKFKELVKKHIEEYNKHIKEDNEHKEKFH